MVKKGDILVCRGMTLRVVDARANWIKCEYLDKNGEWKPRAVTENRKRIEMGLADGTITKH